MLRAHPFGKIARAFWTDERVRKLPSVEDRLLAVYLIAGPQQNLIGCAPFSVAKAAEDLTSQRLTGNVLETFAERFVNVVDLFGWTYDSASVLYLRHWWRYNQPQNPNQLKGWLSQVLLVPSGQSLTAFCANDLDVPEGMRETFHETLAKRLGERYPQPSRNNKSKSKKKKEKKKEEEGEAGREVAGEVVLRLPVMGPAETVGFTGRQIAKLAAEWKTTEPAVTAALWNAIRFLEEKPGNRPTPRGVTRFVRYQIERHLALVKTTGNPLAGVATKRGGRDVDQGALDQLFGGDDDARQG